MLESASNAGAKGLGAFETPVELAGILRALLPKYIEVITDFCAGHGNLAVGCADGTTTNLLLVDIQRLQTIKPENRPVYQTLDASRAVGDITKFFPLLKSVDWRGDCFVNNPPFNMHWSKDNLAELAQSDMSEVRAAFAVTDTSVGKGKIDSTVATILMTLDAMSNRGEGILISNGATMDRLILDDGAPYGMLKKFIWISLSLDGNPMTKAKTDAWGNEFKTSIIGYAKDHKIGPQMDLRNIPNSDDLKEKIRLVPDIRHRLRTGMTVLYAQSGHRGSAALFESCRHEFAAMQKSKRQDWNIFLDGDIIKTSLSRYDEALENISVNKKDAAALFRMNGANPMSLVLQSETRAALVRATRGDIWRVQPELTAEVDRCIAEYSAARAPLYALSDVQRLGYCDEEKFIRCKKELRTQKDYLLWAPGLTYEMRTKTVTVERTTEKPNLAGEMETILLSGAELVIEIKGEDNEFHSFLDQRHRRDGVTVTLVGSYSEWKTEFNLQDLLEHFHIPDVPDVSVTSVETYEANKALLGKIQDFVNEFINA